MAGNPLAAKFERAKRKSSKLDQDYKACAGNNDELAKFRQNWAMGEYTNYLKSKTPTKSFSKSKWRKGQYMPLGRVAHKEGGGKLGFLQARGDENKRQFHRHPKYPSCC